MIIRLLLACYFLFQIVQAQGESLLGGLPGAPFRMGFGAAGIGFGNALAATPELPISGYYNPALLPFQRNPLVQISGGFLTLDRHLAFLTYGGPVKPSGGVSLGIINSGVSNLEQRDADGQSIGLTSTSENTFFLSFGVSISSQLAVGISTKIFYYKLFTDIHSTTIGFDFGALYLLSDELILAAVIQDVGSNYKWDTTTLYGLRGNTTREFFPMRKKVGLSFSPSAFPILAAVELERLASTLIIRSGLRVELLPEFSIQAGIDQIDCSGSLPAKPSVGFSIKTDLAGWKTALDYAFVFEPYAPSGFHVLSLGINFE